MRRIDARVLLACALILLAACGRETGQDGAVLDALVVGQEVVAAQAAPVVVAVRETVQQVVEPLQPEPASEPVPPVVSEAGRDLIVRWEVSSEAYYTQRLRWPIWPGGASGVTWGIGYDGGHQTRTDIGAAWYAHRDVTRLQATSGITGTAAQPVAVGMRDVLTDFGYASQVFGDVSLPVYHAGARRTYGGDAFDALPQRAIDALVSVQYNRGGATTGERNREKRAIRDVCVPAADVHCIAREIRSMCRLWQGTTLEAGLCGRREDEARHAEASV